MSVKGLLSVAIDVPEIDVGVAFYRQAGMIVTVEGRLAEVGCVGRRQPSIILRGGADRKRLHHVTLKADQRDFPALREKITKHGGTMIDPLADFDAVGLWLRDPHGMVIQLRDEPDEQPLDRATPFEINAPSAIVRKNRSAMRARSQTPVALPLRLGHVLLFTPDVMASVAFMRDALGMGLADHAQDVIAFMCCKRNSDHHVVAFAKSSCTGFHHASFQVNDPDEVGRAGARLAAVGPGGNWGFGRHTIGSNFFHYIQDPWGSWFEYYSDIDYIEDHSVWAPTNYEMEDALANWGPVVPDDFVFNYEAKTT